SKRKSSPSRASGRPDTRATASAISSTRPTERASGLRSTRDRTSRSAASQSAPSMLDAVMAGQLLDDASQIAPETVPDDGVRRLQLEPGDEGGIDRDGKVERPAQSVSEGVAAGFCLLGAERARRRQLRLVPSSEPVAARLGQ